jgi:capsular polysaccharide biosynthesis protein
MNNEDVIKNEEVIKIEEVIGILTKRWKMIIAITLAATVLSGIVSFFVIAPKYKASTKVFIGKENSDSKNQDYNNSDIQMYQQLLKTYAEVIKTTDLVEKAIDDSGVNTTSNEVLANLTVTPEANTQILEIDYISKDKNDSKELLDDITDEFIKTSRDLIPNGNVKIVEQVRTPEAPASPNKKLNIAIAFLLGLMVSVGLAFLLEFIDNTFKTKDQLEQVLGVPVLGAIPDDID